VSRHESCPECKAINISKDGSSLLFVLRRPPSPGDTTCWLVVTTSATSVLTIRVSKAAKYWARKSLGPARHLSGWVRKRRLSAPSSSGLYILYNCFKSILCFVVQIDAPSLNIGRSYTTVDLERALKKRLRSSFYDRQEPTNWAVDVNDQVCMDINSTDDSNRQRPITRCENNDRLQQLKRVMSRLLECKKQSFHEDNDIAT
jgi:hypothetical protein